MIFLNKFEKLYAKEFDSKYEDFRKVNQKEKIEYIRMLLIHEQLSKLDLNKTQMDFDETNLHPSAIWDIVVVYPQIESGYTFKPHVKDVFVNDFKN